MAKEFTVKGIQYKQMPLDTMKQFYLCIEAAHLCMKMDDNPLTMAIELSKMPHEKLHYLIDLCMPVVQRLEHGTFTQIYVSGAFMYPDITSGVIVHILAAVIDEYLVDFFADLDPRTLNIADQVEMKISDMQA